MCHPPFLSAVVTGLLVLVISACNGGGDSPQSEPAAPPSSTGLTLQPVTTALTFPVFLTSPPGDATRLFVVEKRGTIRIIRDGTLLPGQFVNLMGQVSTGGEQGLLGMAFDPNYAANRRFYVNYTNPNGDTVIARFLADAVDPDATPATLDRVLLTVTQPFANHNGGMLAFGPDGLLYIGLGDGGSGGDPDNRAQNLNDLLGKMLRIDVSHATPPLEYSIPPDNPFAVGGGKPEIWSLGLRNPWRYSFDRQTGDFYIADVGQGSREEVNVSLASSGGGRGLNYGWRLMEGTACFNPPMNCNPGTLTLPVLDYDHSGGACSVTGGYVYRGQAIPNLRGTYFYADFCAGWVRSFRFQTGQVTEQTDWALLRPGGNITSFGEDAVGELYIMTSQGGLFRIVSN